MIATLAAIDINEGLMRSILTHGSKDYELEQSAVQAKALIATDEESRRHTRRWPMLEAATNLAETYAVKKCTFFMFDATLMDVLIDAASRTVRFRCLAYRLLSSCEANIARTLLRENANFPTKGFTVLHLLCLCILKCAAVSLLLIASSRGSTAFPNMLLGPIPM